MAEYVKQNMPHSREQVLLVIEDQLIVANIEQRRATLIAAFVIYTSAG